jgi:signal transduction histidine kinase
VLGREGKTHTFDARFVPLRMLSDRGARMLVAVVREVTEHRVLEAQLLQSRKLEAVGQLAGGVAHDFNNMLAGIMGYAELLKLRAKDTDTAHAASEIVSISEHAAELTARLLAFSRRKKAQSAPTDVHELAERVCGILKHTVDRRIEVRLDGDRRGCCVVEGDPAQLESALLNLALNARDAMPEGGTLTLRMRCVVPDAVLRDKLPAPQAETYVQLEVEDTGEGIDPAILDRIFEPFFTTKAPGRGSGLGLAAVYGAVSAHHGLVDVRSTLGQGTCFRLLLPCAGQAVRAKLEEATHMVAPGGHVLVVDDEQAVRQTATLCLEEAGYRVSGAADGRAALELVRSGARFDLVLLDMIMPVMGGAEVLRELRRVAPGLPVLIASGYSPGEAEVAGADGFLQKPYRRAELLKRVAALLGPRRRAAGDA